MFAFFAATLSLFGMRDTPGPCLEKPVTVAERQLLWAESRGWPTADNPRSTAFGCGQLLVRQRRAYAPLCDTHHATLEVDGQLCMFRRYVSDRYGTADQAWAFWKKRGWY